MLTTLAWGDCLPPEDARKHVGEIKCVTGKVVRVKQGARGVHFLDFCDDFRLCPFTVVIFPSDLKSVGDVRQLQGRLIGRLKSTTDGGLYSKNTEQAGQVAEFASAKNYDVEKKGRYSAEPSAIQVKAKDR